MNKITIYLITTLLISNFTFAQISLEHSYSNPNTISTDDLFFTFNSETELHYYTFNKTTKIVQIYDENHNLIKTFTAPIPTDYSPIDILVTDKLFNSDNNFEFLFKLQKDYNADPSLPFYIMSLVDDNGLQIQQFDNRNFAKIVKNNSGHYKLILKGFEVFDVYSLSGTLSANQENNILNNKSPYPNPADEVLNIINNNFSFSNKRLEVYSADGKKVLEKIITPNQEHIKLNISNLNSGLYVYKLNGQTVKFVKK